MHQRPAYHRVWQKKHNFLLNVTVDKHRICFEVCSVISWKAEGKGEPVCDARDGLPGGHERIEVSCDAAAFLNLALAHFNVAEFTRPFLDLAWKEALFCIKSSADTPSSNLLVAANSLSLYAVLECV